MKNLNNCIKSLLLVFLLAVLSFQTIGQPNEGIQNIQPIPAIPNNAEVLQFDVDAFFNNGSCVIMAYDFEIYEHSVLIRICYLTGNTHIPCFPKDTVTIGQLPAGDFEFIFQAFKYNYEEGCFEQDISTDTVLVTIAQHTSTGMPVEEAVITFQPNPFKDHFTIQVEQNALHRPVSLRLYDYHGREVYFQTLDRSIKHRVNTTQLPAGVYMYRLELENGQEVSGKVVKY